MSAEQFSIELVFVHEKVTPGTVRYRELVDDGRTPVTGTIYLKKDFVKAVGRDVIGWRVTLVPIRENDAIQENGTTSLE